jgi:uncharacterized protein (UPF0548 family)
MGAVLGHALRRPRAAQIDRLLAEAKGARPTYPEIGQTRVEQLPAGYRLDRYERRLGRGDEVFGRAAAALRAWQAQIGAGTGSSRTEREPTRKTPSSRSGRGCVPVDRLARLASPVTRLIQQRVTRRYLEAIAAASGS